MASKKQQVRAAFRNACFKRDGYKCAVCGKTAPKDNIESVLDAHHITPREEFPNGGYVKENGISLCKADKGLLEIMGSCHMQAEEYYKTEKKHWITGYHPNDLYAKIGSNREKAFVADARLIPF